MLRELVAYAERLDAAPTLYGPVAVRYLIELDAAGRLRNPRPTDQGRDGLVRLMPNIARSGEIKPWLLADVADYTLGLGESADCAKRHDAYRDQVARCAEATDAPEVRAVAAFLADRPAERLELPDDFTPKGVIAFSVDGVFPTDLPEVQVFWSDEHNPNAGGASDSKKFRRMQCAVCGEERTVLLRLQSNITSLRGAKKNAVLVSAYESVYHSYGLHGTFVAPTCARCGQRSTTALNALLTDPNACIELGDSTLVSWSQRPTERLAVSVLSEPTPRQVQDLIAALEIGGDQPEVDETAFYGLVLTGNSARVVVRDWISTTVANVTTALARWFLDQAVVDRTGALAPPVGITRLVESAVRDPGDLSKLQMRKLTSELLTCALFGGPFPRTLLARAIQRCQIEHVIPQARAALIKLALTRLSKEPIMEDLTALTPDSPDPAYQFGRLMVVFAALQRAAVGTDAGVRRLTRLASTSPARAMGLVRGQAEPHLAKLKRDQRGLAHVLTMQMREITDRIRELPVSLSLERQGRFWMGFSHQESKDYADMLDRQAAKAAKAAAAADATPSAESDQLDLF